MKRRILALGAVTVALAAAWGASRSVGVDAAVPPAPSVLAEGWLPSSERDQQIAFFQQRLEADPWSADDQAWLATLYLQRARETGSHEDVVRAEQSARRSLELRRFQNVRPWGTLAASLLEQHRFREALAAAEALVETEPESPAYRAALGEVQMELGEYRAAHITFRSVEHQGKHLDVAPRLARWMELNGRDKEARGLLYAARDLVLTRTDLPRELKAWFQLRVGDFELRNGRLDEAETALRAGLAISPDDYRLLSAMARLEAARGQWNRSLQHGEQVLGQLLDPNTLVLMSEVALAAGDSAQSEQYAQVLRVAVQGQDTPHRQWSLFLLDQGEDPAAIEREARAELRTRADIYGHDVLAWALHRQGRHAEARGAMDQALRLDTPDAMLWYHSGMIHHALGDAGAAERDLARALEINKEFHPLHAATARSTLRSLRPWYRRFGL